MEDVSEFIKVPHHVIGIRFPDINSEGLRVGYSRKKPLQMSRSDWYVFDPELFRRTKKIFYEGHLDSKKGRLVLGLEGISEDYDHEKSIRNPSLERWNAGNVLGALYTLTERDLEQRIAANEVHLGRVDHPFDLTRLTYSVSKKDLLEVGDKVVCMRHSGDCFFDYQLLYEVGRDLVAVDGMDFGAYHLVGEPTKLLRIEFSVGR